MLCVLPAPFLVSICLDQTINFLNVKYFFLRAPYIPRNQPSLWLWQALRCQPLGKYLWVFLRCFSVRNIRPTLHDFWNISSGCISSCIKLWKQQDSQASAAWDSWPWTQGNQLLFLLIPCFSHHEILYHHYIWARTNHSLSYSLFKSSLFSHRRRKEVREFPISSRVIPLVMCLLSFPSHISITNACHTFQRNQVFQTTDSSSDFCPLPHLLQLNLR